MPVHTSMCRECYYDPLKHHKLVKLLKSPDSPRIAWVALHDAGLGAIGEELDLRSSNIVLGGTPIYKTGKTPNNIFFQVQ